MTYRKDVLPNGIRVVTEAMPHVRSVAVGIWVETGSRVEPEERGGISHLIEHLVFKGTETRSAEDIARAIDSVGGQMDAFTAKEQTCFYVSVLDEHLPLAVDLLTDILRHPRFTDEDIEKEKAVVFQEIKMVEDTADDLIHDLFAERFWAEHPLGRPILGRWDVVQGFNRDSRPRPSSRGVRAGEDHHRGSRTRRARPGRRAVRGGHFDGFARPGRRHDLTPPVPHATVHVVPKPLEQVHLVIGFPGIARCRGRALRALPPQRCDRGQHVLAPLPGDPRAPGARLLGALGHRSPTATRGFLRLRGDGCRQLQQGREGAL